AWRVPNQLEVGDQRGSADRHRGLEERPRHEAGKSEDDVGGAGLDVAQATEGDEESSQQGEWLKHQPERSEEGLLVLDLEVARGEHPHDRWLTKDVQRADAALRWDDSPDCRRLERDPGRLGDHFPLLCYAHPRQLRSRLDES